MKIKSLFGKFIDTYYKEWWNIAICDIGEDLTPQNIHWVTPTYKDRWFADPFIISDDDESYIVLVEEYLKPEHKGRLARLTISKHDYHIVKNETILNLNSHLSFPNYLEYDGKFYIYPENSKAGHLNYYEYDEQLKDGRELINQPLADAVIFSNNGFYYMLATQLASCNGNVCEIYKSSSALFGYQLVQKISFLDNTARSAGNIFEYNEKLIRPAQVCNNAYGEGLCFQEMIINDNNIELKEFKRMIPITKDYPNGFHTYNVYGKKVIIDGYRYRSSFLRNVCKLILKLNDIRKRR